MSTDTSPFADRVSTTFTQGGVGVSLNSLNVTPDSRGHLLIGAPQNQVGVISADNVTVFLEAGQVFHAGDMVYIGSDGRPTSEAVGQVIGVVTRTNMQVTGNIDSVEVVLTPQNYYGATTSGMASVVEEPLPDYLGTRAVAIETTQIRATAAMQQEEDASVFRTIMNSVNAQSMAAIVAEEDDKAMGVMKEITHEAYLERLEKMVQDRDGSVGVSEDTAPGDGSRWDEI